jgi:hypothetical protein
MQIDLEDIRRHYALLSDEALLAIHRSDLIEEAQVCLDEEIAKRHPEGLPDTDSGPEPTWQEAAEVESGDDESGVDDSQEPEAERGAVVSIASYTHADEARLARGLLEIAGIPSFLGNEQNALGGALHLLVPTDLVDAALEVLADDISDEELAAQAEAAGFEIDPEATEDFEDAKEAAE